MDRKPPVMCIIIDDSRESKLVVSEIERDWASYSSNCEEYHNLVKMDELRESLWVREIVIIRYDDTRACRKQKVRQDFLTYPVYRFDAEPFQHFPKQMYATPTWCLKTIDVLANKYYESRRKFLWLHRKAVENHHEEVIDYCKQFVKDNCLQHHPDFTRNNWCYWELGAMGETIYGNAYYGNWGPNPELLSQIGGFNPPKLKLKNIPNNDFEWVRDSN